MTESFIFTGMGFVTGDYKVTNQDIYEHIKSGYLEGFDEGRVIESDDFKQVLQETSEISPIDYMVEKRMGFKKRFYVVPFPPSEYQYQKAKNSLDLCIDAIDKALKKSGISGNDIDAWFVGTATAHQKAPGIAEFVKAYFTDIDNFSPTFSQTSACGGFNINLESAIAYFKSHKDAKHIVVAHSEVMSRLLLEERDFVPYSTFGDSAAAVILSRVETSVKTGVIDILNIEDTQMLDFLGADRKGRLYMDPRMVKYRAVPNIINISSQLLEKSGWNKNDLLYFIPHQTGDIIVLSAAKELGISKDVVFQEIQKNYGNLSGASIPACFCLLEDSKRLIPGGKIITAVTGLGGESGGFSYIVPENIPVYNSKPELSGKKILITGATGALGKEIAKLAAQKGAELILHYNSNDSVANQLLRDLTKEYGVKAVIKKADLSQEENINVFLNELKKEYLFIDYLINTHAITGGLGKASKVSPEEFETVMNANYLSVKRLCEGLKENVKDCILITGSVGEEAQFPGSSSYVASKRALRSFAVSFAAEIYEKGRTRCVYYIPGIIDSGMVERLDHSQQKASMNMVGQKKLIPVRDIAERMLKSVYRLKIQNARIHYETNLKVIKDGYLNF
ncbi:MAG: SDR family NAD(P)-dependent oxidoreductase [Bacteroidales bacterium]|jgi:3-oxoacyl-[acyl-carrier-protein] synthase III/NAD(P)-dependent dehydrogenase (short-subunit alcohol dehydrogenase family)|nr:SDR family NAD(P)-dependent oxidoreductase [Bacteroidales bacterium]